MNISQQFLWNHAGKQFVALRARVHPLNGSGSMDGNVHIWSCFVVEVGARWFLVTAGHVIDGIRHAFVQGARFEGWWLHDEAAGHGFEGGVPYPFELDGWLSVRIDEQGLDYAATELPKMVVDLLAAGGIQPISEAVWGYVPPKDCDVWLLVGMPKECLVTISANREMERRYWISTG